MALISKGVFGEPRAEYELHAHEYATASGTTRYITVTFKIRIPGSSRYGYSLDWEARVGGYYSGRLKVKGTEFWYGPTDWYTYTWNCAANVGTTSAATVVIGFQTRSTDNPGTTWAQTRTANYTTSASLTKPDTPTNLRVSGYYEEGEQQTFAWNAAARASAYNIYHSVYELGKGWSEWYWSAEITGTSYTFGHGNIGGLSRSAIKYRVIAKNAAGNSGAADSGVTEHYGVRAWNGSKWAWAQMRVWNGSSWVKIVPRAWTGSAWKYT